MDEKRTVLIIAMLAAFLTPFNGSSINIALPAIKWEFSATLGQIGWVALAYLLTSAVFLVPFGRIGDIYGRKKVFVSGIFIFTLSSALAVMARGIESLIFFRVLQGVGSSMIFGTSMAISTSVFPLEERGKVLGMTVASVYTGLSAGPFIGGYLTAHFGWRSIFAVSALIGIPAFVLASIRLRGEWADAKGHRFDTAGAVLYSAMFFFFMYGLSLLPEKEAFAYLTAGAALFALFAWRENTFESPLFDMRMFLENRVFAFSNIAALIHYSATFGISFLLSLYLQYVKGMDPRQAGTVLVAQPVMMALFSPVAGRLSDRIEPRFLASAGMALTAAGLGLLAAIGEATPTPYIAGTLVLIGFGFAMFTSPNTNAVMSSIDRRFYGVASSTLSTMRLAGQMISVGFASSVLSVCVGKRQVTPACFPDFILGVRTAFTVFAALCVIGVFLSLVRGKVRG